MFEFGSAYGRDRYIAGELVDQLRHASDEERAAFNRNLILRLSSGFLEPTEYDPINRPSSLGKLVTRERARQTMRQALIKQPDTPALTLIRIGINSVVEGYKSWLDVEPQVREWLEVAEDMQDALSTHPVVDELFARDALDRIKLQA